MLIARAATDGNHHPRSCRPDGKQGVGRAYNKPRTSPEVYITFSREKKRASTVVSDCPDYFFTSVREVPGISSDCGEALGLGGTDTDHRDQSRPLWAGADPTEVGRGQCGLRPHPRESAYPLHHPTTTRVVRALSHLTRLHTPFDFNVDMAPKYSHVKKRGPAASSSKKPTTKQDNKKPSPHTDKKISQALTAVAQLERAISRILLIRYEQDMARLFSTHLYSVALCHLPSLVMRCATLGGPGWVAVNADGEEIKEFFRSVIAMDLREAGERVATKSVLWSYTALRQFVSFDSRLVIALVRANF